ncbi:MAG: hypothetical protein WC799_02240 [Desulfobacteraceae bacterium]
MIQFAKNNKDLLFIIAFFLFVLELVIFINAFMQSGDHSKIQVLNNHDEVIYESDENKLYQFDRYYFEKNFGPLENYKKRRLDIENSFPFRGWMISAIGIPVGFMLVLGFIFKTWAVFFRGEKPVYENNNRNGTNERISPSNRFEQIIVMVSNMNIFVLGFFIVAALFLYWVLPDMIMFISRMGLETIIRFKWFFIGVFLTIAGLFSWFIYLRYLLARKAIESRTEIEKIKLQIIHETDNEEIARKLLTMDRDGKA